MASSLSGLRLRLDLRDERLWDGDQAIALSPKEFALLSCFVRHPNRLLTKREILTEVWPDTNVTEGSVKDFVKILRRKLGDEATRPGFIETVRGRGYRYLGGIVLTRHTPIPEDRSNAPAQDSITILDFDSAEQSAPSLPVAKGLATQIATRLTKTRYYRVIASGMRSSCTDPQRAGLYRNGQAARWLLDGRVETMGELLRTNVRVLSAATGEICWTQNFDLMPKDPRLDIDHLSRLITGSLCGIFRSLIGPAPRLERNVAFSSLSARDQVLYGSAFYLQRTRVANDEAIKVYHKCMARYPDDFYPRQALAFALIDAVRYGWTKTPGAYLQRAHTLVRRSHHLNQGAYEVHWAVGFTNLMRRDFDGAVAAFETALALNPNVPNLIADLGELYLYLGRPEDAIAQVKEARAMNPCAPFTYADILARAQCDLGDLEGALDTYRAMGPAAERFTFDRAIVLTRCGRRDEASRMLQASGSEGALIAYLHGLKWGRPYRDGEGALSCPEAALACLSQVGISPQALRPLGN